MKTLSVKKIDNRDRVEGDKIILNGRGRFPKRVIIREPKTSKEYRLIKTVKGGYLLT